MNYELRPPRRGLLPVPPAEIPNHIARIEYSVSTKADCAFVWSILTDPVLWQQFCARYGKVQWQGAPWSVGSRMRLDLREPVNVTVDRAITVCNPPRLISWINHVRGYTMEQWTSLDPLLPAGTCISTWLEVNGGDPSRDQTEDMRLLESIVKEWFDNFTAECDRRAKLQQEQRRSPAM